MLLACYHLALKSERVSSGVGRPALEWPVLNLELGTHVSTIGVLGLSCVLKVFLDQVSATGCK